MTGAAEIEAEVEALARLDLNGLREAWRRRYGPTPPIRSPDLLRRMLAFEIQAGHFGGLDPELRRRLRRTDVEAPRRKPGLQPGTRIVREWRGGRHEVEVVDGGFQWEGSTYSSLSDVARAITGTRWSGPRFFGLTEKAAS